MRINKFSEGNSEKSNVPIIADIHFHYKRALEAPKVVQSARINPGNIGQKKKLDK